MTAITSCAWSGGRNSNSNPGYKRIPNTTPPDRYLTIKGQITYRESRGLPCGSLLSQLITGLLSRHASSSISDDTITTFNEPRGPDQHHGAHWLSNSNHRVRLLFGFTSYLKQGSVNGECSFVGTRENNDESHYLNTSLPSLPISATVYRSSQGMLHRHCTAY
jgi:hypothetical protein